MSLQIAAYYRASAKSLDRRLAFSSIKQNDWAQDQAYGACFSLDRPFHGQVGNFLGLYLNGLHMKAQAQDWATEWKREK